MSKTVQAYKYHDKNQKKFEHELMIYVNEKLFQKKIISEDMYLTAKDRLMSEVV